MVPSPVVSTTNTYPARCHVIGAGVSVITKWADPSEHHVAVATDFGGWNPRRAERRWRSPVTSAQAWPGTTRSRGSRSVWSWIILPRKLSPMRSVYSPCGLAPCFEPVANWTLPPTDQIRWRRARRPRFLGDLVRRKSRRSRETTAVATFFNVRDALTDKAALPLPELAVHRMCMPWHGTASV